MTTISGQPWQSRKALPGASGVGGACGGGTAATCNGGWMGEGGAPWKAAPGTGAGGCGGDGRPGIAVGAAAVGWDDVAGGQRGPASRRPEILQSEPGDGADAHNHNCRDRREAPSARRPHHSRRVRQYAINPPPKIVGGLDPVALAMADTLYGALVVKTVKVSSAATAEAVKLTENIFRAVNIALVNELKV